MQKNLLLFDFNNLAHRCVHIKQISTSATEESWSLLAYMIFHIMYDFTMDTADYLDEGDRLDVVLALDSSDGYWRRDLYPPYKADRAKKRSQDEIDWARAYVEFNKLTDVIAKYTPWKVLRVSKCEADDIIYTLATGHTDGFTIIHSGDSDYLQLVSDGISLYSTSLKDYVEFPHTCKVAGTEVHCQTPAEYLQYAILTGQGGKDNVYNVKTPTDWDSAAGKRKPGFGVMAAMKVLKANKPLEETLTEMGLYENYLRNKKLIDMKELPDEYLQSIRSAYAAYAAGEANVSAMLKEYRWPSIVGVADDMTARLHMAATGICKVEYSEGAIDLQSMEEAQEFVL